MDNPLTQYINRMLTQRYKCIEKYLENIYNSPSTINKLLTHLKLEYKNDYRELAITLNGKTVKSCMIPMETTWQLRKYSMYADMGLAVIETPPVMFIGDQE